VHIDFSDCYLRCNYNLQIRHCLFTIAAQRLAKELRFKEFVVPYHHSYTYDCYCPSPSTSPRSKYKAYLSWMNRYWLWKIPVLSVFRSEWDTLVTLSRLQLISHWRRRRQNLSDCSW